MAVFFAGTWVAAHWATEEIPPLTVAFLRFLVATLLLWVWARLTGVPIRVGRADLPLVVAMGVSGIFLYNVCFLYGVKLAPSSDGAVIVPGLSPVVVAALVAVRYGIRPPGRAMAGLGLALVGLVVVIGPAMTSSPARALGDLLFVAGAVCWAVYSVLSRAATVRFHPVAVTLAAAAFGAAAFAPFALVERGWEPVLDATPRALASVVYLGALGTVVAFVAFAEGIRRIGAPRHRPSSCWSRCWARCSPSGSWVSRSAGSSSAAPPGAGRPVARADGTPAVRRVDRRAAPAGAAGRPPTDPGPDAAPGSVEPRIAFLEVRQDREVVHAILGLVEVRQEVLVRRPCSRSPRPSGGRR